MKIAGFASKRENQILDLVYERGRVTATEVEEALPGRPSNSAVRWQLRTLESKGLLTHIEENGTYVYLPTSPRETVAKGELSRLVSSFFGGSVTSVMTALMDQQKDRLTEADIEELHRIIDRAGKEEGK